MDAWLEQRDAQLRLQWGPTGATAALAAGTDVVVVVDVLSFTTAVSVALDNGTEVIPFPERGAAAGAAAAAADAVLAAQREPRGGPVPTSADGSSADPGLPSLSPTSLRASAPPARLLLPSPNGARISAALGASGRTVIGGCLRNAAAVAHWIRTERPGASVALVPAGERWPDGSLRPASEDAWGAGAVLDTLLRLGVGPASPEASDAVACYRAAREAGLLAALRRTTSGLELSARGYEDDVAVAAELASTEVIPLLQAGRFAPA